MKCEVVQLNVYAARISQLQLIRLEPQNPVPSSVSLTMRDSMLYVSMCGSCKPVILPIDTTMVHVMLAMNHSTSKLLSTDSVPYNAHHCYYSI